MSETPLPHTVQSADAAENAVSTGEYRARKRGNTADLRPVSAFSPGHRQSEPPPPALSDDERTFVTALRAAGIASELNDSEQVRTAPHIRGESRAARRLSLLATYYDAEHDVLASQRRKASDRWFLFDAADGLTAQQLLARLLDVVPELQGTELERVGGRDGTLVLRDDDDVCALEDEQEVQGKEHSTISVSDLVRAINVLLDRRAVRVRLVGLIGDGRREGYLGLPSVAAGIALSSADYLAVTDAEALLDLTGW